MIIDLMIDAYARSVAAAGNDPANAQSKTLSSTKLTEFYKFRHQGSEVGLSDVIAGALAKPLPLNDLSDRPSVDGILLSVHVASCPNKTNRPAAGPVRLVVNGRQIRLPATPLTPHKA